MHPDLVVARRAIDTTCGAVPLDLLASPHGDKWTGAQVLEHLAKAYGTTAHILDKCVREQRTVGTAASTRQRFFTWLIVRVGYFPPNRQAPAVTRPDGMPPAAALDAARAALQAFDEAATRALAAFGPVALVANHPILGGFTVDRWRRFHRVHTVHHMRLLARSPAWAGLAAASPRPGAGSAVQ